MTSDTPKNSTHTEQGHPIVTEQIDLGQCTIHYERIGSGPDLVFVHGWPLHSATWRNIVPRLADDFTCHLIDLPGTGKTTWPEGTNFNFADQADAMNKILDHLALERFSLVGHDSGGLIARLLAASRPDQVESLIVSGTEIPNSVPWQIRLYVMSAKAPDRDFNFKLMMGTGILRRSFLALGGCFHDVKRFDREFTELFIEPLLSDQRRLQGQVGMLKKFDADHINGLADLHPMITTPTLFIWGEDDPFFPVDKARAMSEQFAGPTRFEVVPNAKLFVHEEHPDTYATMIREFANKLSEQSARSD